MNDFIKSQIDTECDAEENQDERPSFMDEIRKKFSDNAEEFDSLVVELFEKAKQDKLDSFKELKDRILKAYPSFNGVANEILFIIDDLAQEIEGE